MRNIQQTACAAVSIRPAILTDGRYEVRIAETRRDIESALRLRYEVFCLEMGAPSGRNAGIESDSFDEICDHLLVIERATGRTVGTYRLTTIEKTGGIEGFYSFSEFAIERMPTEVLRNAIEIGRACIAAEHRNTRVLFLLWRGLAASMRARGKNYLFGCCSIFTRCPLIGQAAYRQLTAAGKTHESIRIEPRTSVPAAIGDWESKVELPALFEMYLRIGARVCSPPLVDDEFGSTDFLVLLDLNRLSERHRRMFFD